MKDSKKELYRKIGFGITAVTGQVDLESKRRIGNKFSVDKKSAEFMELVFKHGIRFFAANSIEGIDELKIFGYSLSRYRAEVELCINIGLKCDGSSDFSRDYLLRQVEKALKDLQTTYIDFVLINKIPVGILQDNKLIAEIENLKKNGVIKSFGVSSIDAYHAEQITALPICDSIQVMYNLANREIENKDLRNKYTIVKSPLWSGMLTPRAMLSPEYPPLDLRVQYLTREELIKRRKIIKEILDAVKWPVERLVELSVRYLISNNEIDTILFGFNPQQFFDILEIFDKGPLETKELETIRKTSQYCYHNAQLRMA